MAAAGDSKWDFGRPYWMLVQKLTTPLSNEETAKRIASHPDWMLTIADGLPSARWTVRTGVFTAMGYTNKETIGQWLMTGRGPYADLAKVLRALGEGVIRVVNVTMTALRPGGRRKIRVADLLAKEKGFTALDPCNPTAGARRNDGGSMSTVYPRAFVLTGYKQLQAMHHAANELVALLDNYLEPPTVHSLATAMSAMSLHSATASK